MKMMKNNFHHFHYDDLDSLDVNWMCTENEKKEAEKK